MKCDFDCGNIAIACGDCIERGNESLKRMIVNQRDKLKEIEQWLEGIEPHLRAHQVEHCLEVLKG